MDYLTARFYKILHSFLHSRWLFAALGAFSLLILAFFFLQTAAASGLQQEPDPITLDKTTNGPGGTPQDNPFILVGDTVTWTYIITNTGTVDLTAIAVTDDNGTPADPADDLSVCNVDLLTVGNSTTCTATGTALLGAYTNVGTAQAQAGAVTVSDTDSSSYFGASPAVTIQKFTNGADANTPPGPTLPAGSTVSWAYLVRNSGNVALTTVSVSDNQGVTVNCPQTILAVNESMTCSATGVAQVGQYANIGTVTAQPPVGPAVSATDPSHYFGQAVALTSTATATVSLTPTLTSTVTPTITGTLPTPTVTGTITPNPILTVSVSPTQARTNQTFTFTIRLTNPGTAPALNATIANSFPSFIDVSSVTITQGTATKSTHSVSVALGDVMPGANITVTIVVRVNSSLTVTQTVTNQVSVTYNSNLVRTAAVAYSVIPTSVLPGTGQLPISAPGSSTGELAWGLVGMVTLGTGWGILRRRGGIVILSVLALVTLLIVAACSADPTSVTPSQAVVAVVESPTSTLMPFMPAYRFSTPEVYPTLPDYPIPSPTIAATLIAGGSPIDTSPVVRIVIPPLEVDAIVAYIPFEGLTWPIEGLREEVAWLGDTSWPGLGGNTVLAGHITVRGLGDGPFRYLADLQSGDEIVLFTEQTRYTYTVYEQLTVEETDMSVTQPTTNSQLTLITCTGWDQELSIYRFRQVVYASLTDQEPVDRQLGANVP